MTDHYSADGAPVTLGAKFWDNSLRVVAITKVADMSNPYQHQTQTWHRTTGGDMDTLDDPLRNIGRLARRFDGKDAEAYPVGTAYKDAR